MAYDKNLFRLLDVHGLNSKGALVLAEKFDEVETALAITPAANVAVIATPGSATAADCANKINAVINALVAAGLMEEPA